jgi:microcystin-dependent protein
MKKFTFLALLLGTFLTGTKSNAQIDPYLGQIILVPYNFAPAGWARCDGQLLPIAQNTALFSLLGTQFGGNGTTTFALPDLRGRVPMGDGSGTGLTPTVVGQLKGTETNTLSTAQMPIHNHTVNAVTSEGNQNTPTGNLPADTKLLDKEYSNAATNTTMNATMIGNAGGSQPVNNMQPTITLMYIIATQGIYPSHP